MIFLVLKIMSWLSSEKEANDKKEIENIVFSM